MRYRLRVTAVWLAGGLSGLGSAPAHAQNVVIDTLALEAHTRFLSHDLLRGRATGSPGAAIAALYIASQCRLLGLTPVGASYLQQVPLEQATIEPPTALTVRRGGTVRRFTHPSQITPHLGSRRTLVGFAGQLVYVGAREDVHAGALADLGLDGAVAVSLGLLDRGASDTLRRRGAVGMVHVVGDTAAYQRYIESQGSVRLFHADPSTPSSFFPLLPSVIAGPEAGRWLLRGTPLVRGRPMTPRRLAAHADFAIRLNRSRTGAMNVACRIPGSAPETGDTALAFTAHYDHLGVGEPDATGDSIYNGFADNAAGVAMLLALGKALIAHRPRHSLLFLFFGGEERGLLGSDSYVTQPLWPLERTAAVINLDAGAPPAPPTNWRLAGVADTGLGAVARSVALRRGWEVTTSPARPNSDYFPFWRHGVPAVFVIPGSDPYDGLSADSSAALRQRWDHYHQPNDHWAEDFPWSGLVRYATFAGAIALALDRNP